MDDFFLNLRAFLLSLLVHVALLASLAVSLEWTTPPSPPQAEAVEVIQAKAVDESQVHAEIERLTAQERQRQEQEAARQRQLEEQARKAQETLAREKRRLAELEEKRRLEEEKRRQELERLRALKRKKEEEQKRLIKLKEQQEAEARRLKAIEEKRKKEEEAKRRAEEARKKAEQKAAEERRRRQREEALRRKLAEEEKRLQAERARKAQMLVERYKGIIRQKVERNWRRPVGVPEGLSCVVRVKLLPSGDVGEVTIVKSSGNAPFDASVKRAVMKASPLPLPKDRDLFPYFRELEFVFAPKA